MGWQFDLPFDPVFSFINLFGLRYLNSKASSFPPGIYNLSLGREPKILQLVDLILGQFEHKSMTFPEVTDFPLCRSDYPAAFGPMEGFVHGPGTGRSVIVHGARSVNPPLPSGSRRSRKAA